MGLRRLRDRRHGNRGGWDCCVVCWVVLIGSRPAFGFVAVLRIVDWTGCFIVLGGAGIGSNVNVFIHDQAVSADTYM